MGERLSDEQIRAVYANRGIPEWLVADLLNVCGEAFARGRDLAAARERIAELEQHLADMREADARDRETMLGLADDLERARGEVEALRKHLGALRAMAVKFRLAGIGGRMPDSVIRHLDAFRALLDAPTPTTDKEG